MITRFIRFIHRILGALLSILFLVWFLSGMVMIYHTFPRVSPEDRIGKMNDLSVENLPALPTLKERLPENEPIRSIVLNRFLGETVFHIRTDRNTYNLPADPTASLAPVDGNRIARIASLWCDAPIAKVDTLYRLDQWIPFGSLKKEFPIYKFRFADADRHELYLSSHTGNVLQFTDRNSRFWAWLGAIPHWVYFTSLRQDTQRWIDVVIWLSGIGCFMCLAGLYLGIREYRLALRNKKRAVAYASHTSGSAGRRLLSSLTPYKKPWYRWHHLTGLVFGLFVLTFAFSGLMSLAEVPGWISKPQLSIRGYTVMREQAPDPFDYPLDYREAIARYPHGLRQIEWSNFRELPLYTLTTDHGQRVIDASGSIPKGLLLTESTIRRVIETIHGPGTAMHIASLTEPDTYSISRKRNLEFPVWKVSIDNPDHSCYYIHPVTGATRYVNDTSRWRHWMYPALHSLNIKGLVDRPVLWNLAMWGLLTGGTIVSLSGVWLGIRYIFRKIRKYGSCAGLGK